MAFKCPKCDGDTRVLETRDLVDGLYRRRLCDNGHVIHTAENVTKVSDKLLHLQPRQRRRPSLAPNNNPWNWRGNPA